jgi:hypothetical protein
MKNEIFFANMEVKDAVLQTLCFEKTPDYLGLFGNIPLRVSHERVSHERIAHTSVGR